MRNIHCFASPLPALLSPLPSLVGKSINDFNALHSLLSLLSFLPCEARTCTHTRACALTHISFYDDYESNESKCLFLNAFFLLSEGNSENNAGNGLSMDKKSMLKNGVCMDFSMVECKSCGTAYWSNVVDGPIEAGPCCFGHAVLDIENHPTARVASKAYPAWLANREKSLAAKLNRLNAVKEGVLA